MAANTATALKIRRRLMDDVFPNYVGAALSPDCASQFAAAIAEKIRLPAAGPNRTEEAMAKAFKLDTGMELTLSYLDELAWRVAGNYQSIYRGWPIFPWPASGTAGAAEICFESADAYSGPRCRLGYRFITGLPAGRTSVVELTRPEICRVARMCGFDRRSTDFRVGKIVLDEESELFGMFVGVVFSGLEIDEFVKKPTLVSRNRKLMRRRLRVGFDCPLNLTHEELPCALCSLGRDRCAAACRLKSEVNSAAF